MLAPKWTIVNENNLIVLLQLLIEKQISTDLTQETTII